VTVARLRLILIVDAQHAGAVPVAGGSPRRVEGAGLITCTSNADRPDPGSVELDAEREAARRAREPLGPATREAPERPADIEAVKRLIDPTRRRRPRNGDPSKQGYDENDHLSAYD
jgi:hypothetical protein